MNYGLALALFLLAVALLVIGWRGTYAKAWQVLTGQGTTFGQGASVANPAAQGAQESQSANAAAGAGAAAISQEVSSAVNAILKQNGINPMPTNGAATSGNVAGTLGGFQP